MRRTIVWTFLVILGLVAFVTLVNVATAPMGVVNKVVTPDNIVTSYERFYDQLVAFEAKVQQVKGHKQMMSEADRTDKDEMHRLRIELSGMQQACRTLAGEYNANSQKLTTASFKGRTLPVTLDPNLCE